MDTIEENEQPLIFGLVKINWRRLTKYIGIYYHQIQRLSIYWVRTKKKLELFIRKSSGYSPVHFLSRKDRLGDFVVESIFV